MKRPIIVYPDGQLFDDVIEQTRQSGLLEARDDLGNRPYTYLWTDARPRPPYRLARRFLAIAGEEKEYLVREFQLSFELSGDWFVTEGGQPVTLCKYADANYFQGVAPGDAAAIEKLRPSVLDLKLEVMEMLAIAGHDESTTDLWPSFCEILERHLSGDQIELLLRIDTDVMGAGLRPDGWPPLGNVEAPRDNNGGLADFLTEAIKYGRGHWRSPSLSSDQ